MAAPGCIWLYIHFHSLFWDTFLHYFRKLWNCWKSWHFFGDIYGDTFLGHFIHMHFCTGVKHNCDAAYSWGRQTRYLVNCQIVNKLFYLSMLFTVPASQRTFSEAQFFLLHSCSGRWGPFLDYGFFGCWEFRRWELFLDFGGWTSDV